MSAPAEAPPKREARKPEQHRPPLPANIPLHADVLAAQARDILTFLLVVRAANAVCTRTFFQPDEYFQSLEPAWDMAFGPHSAAWLTWEWQHQLRSSLHPALFAGVYIVADKALSLVNAVPPLKAVILTYVPNVAQAVFAALSDYSTWKLAEKVFGTNSTVAWTALWMTVLNPWQWFCSTRTFSNSMEMTLTALALYYWPWELLGEAKDEKANVLREGKHSQSLRLSLLLAAVAVVLRPTNLLIWLAILTLAVTRMTLDGKSPLNRETLLVLVREIVLCGTVVLGISAVSDFLYFGEWTFPPYKWLHFNISQSLAVFYGRNPWHYHLLQGIPLLTTMLFPFVCKGLSDSVGASSTGSILQRNTLKTLSFAVIATVGSLSLISHKEVRFIYPLLPILHVLAAPHVTSFFTVPAPPSSSAACSAVDDDSGPTLRRKPLLYLLVSVNVALAFFLSFLHQPAPLSVTSFVRTEYERIHWDHLGVHADVMLDPRSTLADAVPAEGADDSDELFALFLTPCHSTPWRSRLVWPGLRARALTCEPPLHTAPGSREREDYVDEADRFYASPAKFLAEEMWPVVEGKQQQQQQKRGGELPRYIVGFEGVEDALREFFDEETGPGKGMGVHLRRVWGGWNGYFNEDWRRRGQLVVWDTGVYPDMKEAAEE